MPNDTSRSLLDRLRCLPTAEDWEVFVRLYQPLVHEWLSRHGVPPSDIDDIGQEAMVQVHRAISGFTHNGRRGAFRRWFRQIVFQRLQRAAKRNSQLVSPDGVALDQLATSGPAELEQVWEQEHDRFLVNRMLELLRCEFTETSWQAFRLQVLESQTATAAAKQLGITVNAALIAKSRMLRRLREFGAGLVEADSFDRWDC